MTRPQVPKPREDHDRDERVSMTGPDAEAVLRALLQVDMEDEPADEHTGRAADAEAGIQR